MADTAGDSQPELTAQVLSTLSSGVAPGPWGDPLPPTVTTALDWQNTGVHATFAEFHGATHSLPQGRLSELIGRIAAGGEQLGLAWTCEQDMLRWLDPAARARDGFSASARALAEMAGYYAISAGHGLANVTLRTLLIGPNAAAVINKDYKNAGGFTPFTKISYAWLPLNETVATKLHGAAVASGCPEVALMTGLVRDLTVDPHWQALMDRRHVDFHRWRPQSVSGGVPTSNPWEAAVDGDGSSLTIYGNSQYEPPDTEVLIQEASDALAALSQTMRDWIDCWPAVLRALGVPLFKESTS